MARRRTTIRVVYCSPANRSGSMKPINLRIAEELGVREQQVAAAISLLDGGATVPFVARYRKEATGVLDDPQLRTIEERLRYLRELDERRAAILNSIGQQGKLDAALKQAINGCGQQGAARGSLFSLSAEAAHESSNRPRSRPRPAGGGASSQARPKPGAVGSPVYRTEQKG